MLAMELLIEIVWFLTWLIHVTNSGGSTDDIGMIAYFYSGCPEGWYEYTNLTGRVAIGVGSYVGTREDGHNDDQNFTIGEIGGEINHNLTIAEMPNHNHENGDYKYLVQKYFNTIVDTGNVDNIGDEIDYVTGYEIEARGGSQEHNNLPPYYVLYPCIKEYSIDNFTEYSEFISTIDSLQNEINSIKLSLTTTNPTQAPTSVPSDSTSSPTTIPTNINSNSLQPTSQPTGGTIETTATTTGSPQTTETIIETTKTSKTTEVIIMSSSQPEELIIVNDLTTQEAVINQLFEYYIPNNTFNYPIDTENLMINVSLNNGSDLPQWLFFVESTKRLSGVPTSSDDIGYLYIRVTGELKFDDDDNGANSDSVYDVFILVVSEANSTVDNLNDNNDDGNYDFVSSFAFFFLIIAVVVLYLIMFCLCMVLLCYHKKIYGSMDERYEITRTNTPSILNVDQMRIGRNPNQMHLINTQNVTNMNQYETFPVQQVQMQQQQQQQEQQYAIDINGPSGMNKARSLTGLTVASKITGITDLSNQGASQNAIIPGVSAAPASSASLHTGQLSVVSGIAGSASRSSGGLHINAQQFSSDLPVDQVARLIGKDGRNLNDNGAKLLDGDKDKGKMQRKGKEKNGHNRFDSEDLYGNAPVSDGGPSPVHVALVGGDVDQLVMDRQLVGSESIGANVVAVDDNDSDDKVNRENDKKEGKTRTTKTGKVTTKGLF